MSEQIDDKKYFDENGSVVKRGFLDPSLLAAMTQELEEVVRKVETHEFRGNHMFEDDNTARVIFNPYDLCPTVRQAIDTPEVIGFVRELIGTSVRLDHTKLMCKAAKKGTATNPHQDYYYWQDKNPNQVNMFLAIDRCTVENGCLRIFAGSQKDGLRKHTKEFHAVTGERHWVCQLEPEFLEREVEFLAEPGDVCFFSALVAHRSDPNTSDTDRRCLVVEFDEVGNLAENPGWGSPIPPKHWD